MDMFELQEGLDDLEQGSGQGRVISDQIGEELKALCQALDKGFQSMDAKRDQPEVKKAFAENLAKLKFLLNLEQRLEEILRKR